MDTSETKQKSCFGGCLKIAGGMFGVGILLIFLVLFGYLLLRGAGAFLIISDELQQASAIVIMGGGSERRMGEALELFRDKLSRIIILTETGEYVEDYDYLESFDLQIQLLNNGVPAGNILITDMKATSTLEEARAVLKVLNARQMNSAIIVTDPYHTKRTSIIFNDVFQGSDIQLYFHAVNPSWYNSRSWFLSKDGWKFTTLEYIKLFAYKFGVYD